MIIESHTFIKQYTKMFLCEKWGMFEMFETIILLKIQECYVFVLVLKATS